MGLGKEHTSQLNSTLQDQGIRLRETAQLSAFCIHLANFCFTSNCRDQFFN